MNCLPVFIASDPEWAQKFRDAGVPIVGDDIKSQVGATITHRVLARLFEDRGVRLDRTYQLNVGGNMDFMNMLQRSRLESKKISKTRAVTSVVPHDMDPHNVHIGPSDYVAWLDDRKFAFVRLEGTTFGDVPLNLEYKLEVWDSPNSAGIVIDAVRAAKIALDRHLAGPVLAGMYDTVLRALRDEAGYWWTTYRKAFKQNFKASILPGVLYCVVVTVQIFLVYFCFNLLYHGTNVGVGMWVATVLNLVIFHMLFSYMWPQVVLLDQPFGQTLKNSVNCMIAFLPHALAASLVTVLFWGLVILCMPLGLLLMLIFGFWFVTEVSCQIIYGDIEKVFHIEESIRENEGCRAGSRPQRGLRRKNRRHRRVNLNFRKGEVLHGTTE